MGSIWPGRILPMSQGRISPRSPGRISLAFRASKDKNFSLMGFDKSKNYQTQLFSSLNQIFRQFLNIFNVIILVFIFAFPIISPNNHIHIHICPFLISPNIFVFAFVLKIGSKYICRYVNLNIFIFGPENLICHTLHWEGLLST